MHDLGQRIEEFSEELFADLGLVMLPEEKKADIFARIQEHLHKIILEALGRQAKSRDLKAAELALDGENYASFGRIIKNYPKLQDALEKKINEEFESLKLTIAEEQKNAQNSGSTGQETVPRALG